MAVLMSSADAASCSLERERFVDVLNGLGVEAVPCLKGIAFNDFVRGVVTETYSTAE